MNDKPVGEYAGVVRDVSHSRQSRYAFSIKQADFQFLPAAGIEVDATEYGNEMRYINDAKDIPNASANVAFHTMYSALKCYPLAICSTVVVLFVVVWWYSVKHQLRW